MKNTENYLELAKEIYQNLKEETLDDDRKSLGGETKEEVEFNGSKISILVDGFWEKSRWFDYTVFDSEGNKIYSDNYCY